MRATGKGQNANTPIPEGFQVKKLAPIIPFDPFKYMDELHATLKAREKSERKADLSPEEWTAKWASDTRADAMMEIMEGKGK